MNNLTSCQSGINAQVPPAYSLRNFTQPSCSTAACGINPAILAECCGKPQTSFDTFNTTFGPFISCTIDATDTEAYQRYQNCLVQKQAFPIKCNDQNGITDSVCPTAVRGGPDKTCTVRATLEGRSALSGCCEGGNAAIEAADDSCVAHCSYSTADAGKKLQSCLAGSPGVDLVICNAVNTGKSGAGKSYGSLSLKKLGTTMGIGILMLCL